MLFLRSNAGIHELGRLSVQLRHLRCQLGHIVVAQLLAPGIVGRSQLSEQEARMTKTYLKSPLRTYSLLKIVAKQKPHGPWAHILQACDAWKRYSLVQTCGTTQSPLPCRLGLQALKGIQALLDLFQALLQLRVPCRKLQLRSILHTR